MTGRYSVGQSHAKADPLATANFLAKTQLASQNHRRLSPTLRVEIEAAKRTLNEIAQLDADWDGYGAEAVPKLVRMNAWQALSHFEGIGAVPEITPLSNGTIAFDWHANGVRGHFEVGLTRYSMYIADAAGRTRYFDGVAADIASDTSTTLARALAESSGDEASSARPMTSIRFSGASGA